MKIIDSHIHLGNNLPISRTVGDAETLHQIMRDNLISDVVVLPVDSDPTNNRWLLSATADEPNLYPFVWYDTDGKNLDFVESAYKIYGLKYHPSTSQSPLVANHPVHERAMIACASKHIPLLVHCGRAEVSDAQYVFEIAKTFTGVNFILAHFGGMVVDRIERTINLYREYGEPFNIYFDLANGRHPWLLRDFVDRYGSSHLLFGSDYPFVDYDLTIRNVMLANLPAKVREEIFWRNAEELILQR